jgi:hypothetical protein
VLSARIGKGTTSVVLSARIGKGTTSVVPSARIGKGTTSVVPSAGKNDRGFSRWGELASDQLSPAELLDPTVILQLFIIIRSQETPFALR